MEGQSYSAGTTACYWRKELSFSLLLSETGQLTVIVIVTSVRNFICRIHALQTFYGTVMHRVVPIPPFVNPEGLTTTVDDLDCVDPYSLVHD
jgi:hypothetical protein